MPLQACGCHNTLLIWLIDFLITFGKRIISPLHGASGWQAQCTILKVPIPMGGTSRFIVNGGYIGTNRGGATILLGYPHISWKAWLGHNQPQSRVQEELVIAHILAVELPKSLERTVFCCCHVCRTFNDVKSPSMWDWIFWSETEREMRSPFLQKMRQELNCGNI